MKRTGAFTLIEMIVYISVLTVVLTVAYPTVFRCMRGSRDLQRNAEDIILTLRAGERWRHDVRAATGPIRVSDVEFIIPQRTGKITYTVDAEKLWRIVNQGRPVLVLANVKSSTMRFDLRQQVDAWRWELELTGKAKTTRVRPLFSFIAVPGGQS